MGFLEMSTSFHTRLVAERRRVDEEVLQVKDNMELLESRERTKDNTQTRRATL